VDDWRAALPPALVQRCVLADEWTNGPHTAALPSNLLHAAWEELYNIFSLFLLSAWKPREPAKMKLNCYRKCSIGEPHTVQNWTSWGSTKHAFIHLWLCFETTPGETYLYSELTSSRVWTTQNLCVNIYPLTLISVRQRALVQVYIRTTRDDIKTNT
jgi:hypothetical protein